MSKIPKGKIVVMCSLCYHRIYADSSFLNSDKLRCPACSKAYMAVFSTYTTTESIKAARIESDKLTKTLDRSYAGMKGAQTRKDRGNMHKLYGNRLEDGFKMLNGILED